MNKPLALRDAKDDADFARLNRSVFEWGGYWLLSDGYEVSLCHQKRGEAAEGSVSVPRHIFNRLVARYCEPQVVKPKKRKP